MPAVTNENLTTDGSPFTTLDNVCIGYNYHSLRHNRYWKHTMAAWSSIDAFCSSIYGGKDSKNSLPCHDFPTNTDAFNDTIPQKTLSKCEYHSAEVNLFSINEGQNEFADATQRDDDSNASLSDVSCGSKSSSLLQSTSASSLDGDSTVAPSASPSCVTPSMSVIRQTPISQKHSSEDLSQSQTERDVGKNSSNLRKSSSAMLNSNCQRFELARGSSANISNLDSSQRTSQEDSVETAKNPTTTSANSTSKQETPEVSETSCGLGGVGKNELDRQCSDRGVNQNKLCHVCQRPYTKHKELVLLSPGLFRKTIKSQRTGRRAKKIVPNHKFLYRRRNDMTDSTISYCSLLTSNFLLSEALQAWVGRRLGRTEIVKVEANDTVNDSSIKTGPVSESLKSKLYELLKKIKSHAQSGSSASDVTKEIITAGTGDVGDSNMVLGNYSEDKLGGDNNDRKNFDDTDREENDEDLHTASNTNTMQADSMSKGTYENTPPYQEYKDWSQTTFNESISNAASISDPRDMSNITRNPNSKLNQENIYFQDICIKPGKAYIENRRSRRQSFQGGKSNQRKQSAEQTDQGKVHIGKGTVKDAHQEQGRWRAVSKHPVKLNEDAHWNIVNDGRRQFSNKKVNYNEEENDTDHPSINLEEVSQRRNVVMNAERISNTETTGDNESVDVKQRSKKETKHASGKNYHYKCVKIGDRETILQLEHNPNTFCYTRNTSNGDQTKRNGESVMQDCNFQSDENLPDESKEGKIGNTRATEKPVENADLKSEKHNMSFLMPCRESKSEEEEADLQNEIAVDKIDDDNTDDEVKYSKVFHKKYSRFEAAKERRMMRRFALERLKANEEKSELEGEMGSPRKQLPWPDIFRKLLKRRQKHSNKKCIIGKQAMSVDDEKSQQIEVNELTEGAAATITPDKSAKATIGPVESAVVTVGPTNEAKPPLCNRPEGASTFLGLSFLDRFLRVPEPTHMTPRMTSELESLSHTKDVKAVIAAYYSKESQDVPKGSRTTDGDRKETYNKTMLQVPESEQSKIPDSTQLPPKRKFKTGISSHAKRLHVTRTANSKDNQEVAKTEKIDIAEENKSPKLKSSPHIEQTNSETPMHISETGMPASTQLTPKRKFKIDAPSTSKQLKTVKVYKDVEQKLSEKVKNAMEESGLSEISGPTQLAPETTPKVFSQSYNKKMKASAASFFSKTIGNDSKVKKKTMTNDGMTSPHFTEVTHVQKPDSEAATLVPDSEISQELEPTQITHKKQLKMPSKTRTKTLKALNEAYLYKFKQEVLEVPKKRHMEEDLTSPKLEDIEKADGDLMPEVPEPALAGAQGSKMAGGQEEKTGDLYKTHSQDVQAGNRADDAISVSQESLFQQIYNKLLEPVGLRIVDDLEQFGNRNRPLKFSIPASQRLYAPPGSRPVYLSEFLTWLGLKQADLSSSDDGGGGDDDKEDKDNTLYDSGTNKYDYKCYQVFPKNVRVETSASYLRTQRFDRLEETGSLADSSFVSQDSQQIYRYDEGLAEIRGVDIADISTTSGQVKKNSLILPGREDIRAAAELMNTVKSDKDSAEKPPPPSLESSEVSICTSSSKVFHKKYSMKEKLREKEKLGKRSQPPWKSRERVVEERSSAKKVIDKTPSPNKNLFAKQAEKSRQKRQKMQKVKKGEESGKRKGMIPQKCNFKIGDNMPKLECPVDKVVIEDEIGDIDIDDSSMEADPGPCRVCPSNEDQKQDKENPPSKSRHRDPPLQPVKRIHRDLMEPAKDLRKMKSDPGSSILGDQDVEYEGDDNDAVVDAAVENQVEQSASESYSLMDAVNKILQEIPVDIISKKFLDELASFSNRNVPLKFNVPSIKERMQLENAEPVYLSQFLSILKKMRSQSKSKYGDESVGKTSDDSDTSGSRTIQPDLLPKYVRRAGSLSHLISRNKDLPAHISRRSVFLSLPADSISLTRDISNVTNIQVPDIDQSISGLTFEALEAIKVPDIDQASICKACEDSETIPEISQTDTVSTQESPKPVSRVFHKKYSAEARIRENEKLGTLGGKPCKKKEEVKLCRCRDPREQKMEEPPLKKCIFSKHAERKRERERREKESEKEYDEIFIERVCRNFISKDEVIGDKNGKDEIVGDENGKDEVVGYKNGKDEVVGDTNGKDEVVGDKNGKDEIVGDENGKDEVVGYKNGKDEVVGDTNGKDEIGNSGKEANDAVPVCPTAVRCGVSPPTGAPRCASPVLHSPDVGPIVSPSPSVGPIIQPSPGAGPIVSPSPGVGPIVPPSPGVRPIVPLSPGANLGVSSADGVKITADGENIPVTGNISVGTAVISSSLPPVPGANLGVSSAAGVKITMDGENIAVGGDISLEAEAGVSGVVGEGGQGFQGSSSHVLQGTSEILINQHNLLSESATTGVRNRPIRYTIPASFEMYQPPEARPIYMARETSDKILSFLGLRPESDAGEESEPETRAREGKRSMGSHSSREQDDELATWTSWRPEVLTVDRIFPYLRSKFMQSELASTSECPDYERERSNDSASPEDRHVSAFKTRENKRTRSPRHKEKARGQEEYILRSPKGATVAQKEYMERDLDRYRVSKSYTVKSPGLEVVKEEDSQVVDGQRGRAKELFRWVGKSRTDNIPLQTNLSLIDGRLEDLLKGSEILTMPVEPFNGIESENPAKVAAATLANILAEKSDAEVAEKAAKTVDLSSQQKVVAMEGKTDHGSYFKGTFSQAFEESAVGTITLKVLDQIIEFGRRNIPLKFDARPQQFLEMSSAAKPISISRKDLAKALDYLGFGGDAKMDEEESCVSDTTYSTDAGERPPEPPVVKPRDDSSGKKTVHEDVESIPEDEVPECLLRGGTVQSHRELTFYYPTVPLPIRQSSTRRQLNNYEHLYQRPCTGLHGYRSRSQSKMPYFRTGAAICYGRTKQLRSRCDIWSRSELDRSSHFCKTGRYYRKNLFRKRLSLRNILKECEKGKEWKRLEKSFPKSGKEGGHSYENNFDCADIKVGGQTDYAVKKYIPPTQTQMVTTADDVSNCHGGVPDSFKFDFLVRTPRPKDTSCNPDRCSNRREIDRWTYLDRRKVLDLRPEAQGDYINHNGAALHNSCSSSYGRPAATVRKDTRVFKQAGESSAETHQLPVGYPHMKRSAAGLPSFTDTAASFKTSGILRSIGASKNRLNCHETDRWRSTFSNWRGCHSNALPMTTTPADVRLGKNSCRDISNTPAVKPLGHQQNIYAYRDVKTQCPYTSNFYNDDAGKLYTSTHGSSSLLPSRMY